MMDTITLANGSVIATTPESDQETICAFRPMGKRSTASLISYSLTFGLTLEEVDALLKECEEQNPFFAL